MPKRNTTNLPKSEAERRDVRQDEKLLKNLGKGGEGDGSVLGDRLAADRDDLRKDENNPGRKN